MQARPSRLVAGAALALLLGGSAAAQQTVTPAPPAPPAPLRIMPLGDSITFGLPDTGGYRAPLFAALEADLFDVDFVGSAAPNSSPALLDDWHHEGHSGWTLEDLTEFAGGPGGPPSTIEGWLDLFAPSVILLHAGTNDLGLDQLSPFEAASRLKLLLKRIYLHSPEVHVIVAKIIPLDPAVTNWKWAQFNVGVDYVASQFKTAGFSIRVADMYGAFVNHPNWAGLYSDFIHPNQEGFDVMAGVWRQAIVGLLHATQGVLENPPLTSLPVQQLVAESEQDGAFAAQTDDLIARGSQFLASEAHIGHGGGASYPTLALNDGDAGPGALLAADPHDETWVSTYYLDLIEAPLGYDVQEIRGLDYAGGPSGLGGFGAQAFTVLFETIDAPGVWVPLGGFRFAYTTGAFAPPTGGSGEMRLRGMDGPLKSGVSGVRFRFNADPGHNAITAYTEIDVVGAPTQNPPQLIGLDYRPQ
ncbi:GDSL-type esterase/lipase family protein [Engelhardtia mirabilis]|uniref:GDSL-like Lipase/Acylhydrolase n=1 Tax=Engelhardtia mirabilis TaxID=2528011 RepID=A0A518BDT0_9BACT|nr:GDSL-like Lipase/Acylhydrolase [Planctomycetes bacterium Pla133]QDU99467.1 GDSL-like Lipase/Acylhydrolase [Planctomycetes bacterium Pla86]